MELEIIEVLAGEARGLRNAVLSGRLGADPGAVSRAVGELVGSGWVERADGKVKLTGKIFSLGVQQFRAEAEELLEQGEALASRLGDVRGILRSVAAMDNHPPKQGVEGRAGAGGSGSAGFLGERGDLSASTTISPDAKDCLEEVWEKVSPEDF